MFRNLIAGLCAALLVSGPVLAAAPVIPSPPTTTTTIQKVVSTVVFPAKSYGSCSWTLAGDIGPCVNAAIAAAAAAGGGTVQLPAGIYGVATTINQNTSGVHIAGAGVGNIRDTVSNSNYLAVTRLVWNGAAAATMFNVITTGTTTLYSVDVTGIVFDCASIANICFHAQQVTKSTFQVGGAESRSINILFDTNNIDAYGNQDNDISLWSRSTSATYSPTGIVLDSGAGSSYNTSYNRIHVLNAWYAKGDGIVLANVDNDVIDDLVTYPDPSNKSGRPVVFTNLGYTSPNGVAPKGLGGQVKVNHIGTPIYVLGFQTGSVVTPNGGNSCNGGGSGACGFTTYSLTTNGATSQGSTSLSYASTTGVAVGDTLSCTGGNGSGVPINDYVTSYGGANVNIGNPTVGPVASGLACTYGYGITASASPGTYTITASAGPVFAISSASGHNQSSISVASGHLTFTDMVIPWTGTATAGDSWTVVVPTPMRPVTLNWVDKNNSVPNPTLEPGSNAAFNTTDQTAYTASGIPSNILSGAAVAGAGTTNCIAFVGIYSASSTCGSQWGGIFGGVGNSVTGNANVAIGGVGNGTGTASYGFVSGHNNNIGSFYAAAFGDSNTSTGLDGFVTGLSNSNSGYIAPLLYGGYAVARTNDQLCGGDHATQAGVSNVAGNNQACTTLLRGSTVGSPATVATTAASGTGSVATISFGALTVAPPIGSNVTIAGVTPSGYNGTFTVTASSTTSVSYSNATTGAQTVAGTALMFSRLTTDMSAAGAANCINIPTNTAYSLSIDIIAQDRTSTGTKYSSWSNIPAILYRGSGSAGLTMSSLTPAATLSSGTVTGQVLTFAADTSNNCLSVVYNPPTSNTDLWDIQARVHSTEVQ